MVVTPDLAATAMPDRAFDITDYGGGPGEGACHGRDRVVAKNPIDPGHSGRAFE